METKDLFLSEQHPTSRRWVVVEDDGTVAWMYLTEPDLEKPAAECWLYNRVHAPTTFNSSRGEPPVVPATHTDVVVPFVPPSAESVTLKWSLDGESVAIFIHTELVGFIAANQRRGFSKNLFMSGPFGSPIDRALYEQLFVER